MRRSLRGAFAFCFLASGMACASSGSDAPAASDSAESSTQGVTEPSDYWLDPDRVDAEADMLCREATVVHYDVAPLMAYYRERDRLWKEQRQAAERSQERFEDLQERAQGASRTVLLMIMNEQPSARNVLRLPWVVMAFNERCIWPAEDEADPDPQAIEARKIKRQRWRKKFRESWLD